jgi:hypothetical protein
MKLLNIFQILTYFFCAICTVTGQKIKLTGKSAEYCTGMYSRIDWGGNVDPFIKVDLKSFSAANPATGNASLSIIVFEYKDINVLGVTDQSGRKRYICDEELINEGLCTNDQIYQFLYKDNVTSLAPIKTDVLTDLGTNDFSYIVSDTGYYCIAAFNPPYEDKLNNFDMIVNFHNAFGNLPASEIPLLSLYGLLAVVYAVCLCVYLFPIFKHRSELLLLQKYLAAFFIFLTIESILTWSLYDVKNNNKTYPLPGGIQFYIVFVSILNAFKISFSLFLLLIISLGYGIVYLKLPRKLMNGCKILCGIHFILSVGVAWLSYNTLQSQPTASTTDTSKASDSFDADSWVILLVTIPMTIVFMGLYLWILTSLRNTTQMLEENKQIVKLKMYQKLFRLIFGSVLLLLFAFVISTLLIFNDSLTESIEKFWKFNDVLTTFWPACVYFFVFIGIAIIWRPTDTSYLLAASTQVPTSSNDAIAATDAMDLEQYDNDFEFDDLRSLDNNENANPFENSENIVSNNNKVSENPFDDSNQLKNPFDDGKNNLDEQLKKEKEKLKSTDNNDHFELEDETDDELHDNSQKNTKDD